MSARAGLGVVGEGDLAISLGTSDTLMGVTCDPRPAREGHIMVHPTLPGCSPLSPSLQHAVSTRRVDRPAVSRPTGPLSYWRRPARRPAVSRPAVSRAPLRDFGRHGRKGAARAARRRVSRRAGRPSPLPQCQKRCVGRAARGAGG